MQKLSKMFDTRLSYRTQRKIARLRLERFRQGNLVSVGPVAFEAVEFASRFEKDVNHHVAVIEHDPMAVLQAFDRARPRVFAVHSLLDTTRYRLYLHVGTAGGDNEVVRYGTQM